MKDRGRTCFHLGNGIKREQAVGWVRFEEVSTRGEQRKRKQGGSHDCLAYCGGLKIEQVVAKLYGLSAYTVHKRLNKSLHDLSRVVWRNEIFEPCSPTLPHLSSKVTLLPFSRNWPD